jgi:hypothetical protein
VGDGREGERKPGLRVLRGGAFFVDRQGVRGARRYGEYIDLRSCDLGFRVCIANILR